MDLETDQSAHENKEKTGDLPPLRNPPKKMQGPFRAPSVVRAQRYRSLSPTLRVSTAYDSHIQQKKIESNAEWVKRIQNEPMVSKVHILKYSSLPYFFREQMACRENLTSRYFIRNHHTVKFHTDRNISEKNQTNARHRHSNQSFHRFQFLINSEKLSPKELSINFTGHTNVFLYSINTIFI